VSQKRRIAIVGLGMALKPHLAALRDLGPRVEIAACFSPSAERRAAFATAHPDLRVVADLDAALADNSIDAMLLLTPPFTHLDLIRRCAAAGKHVLAEKPLDVSVERARGSVDAMEAAGLRLGVVLQHRFRKASQRLAGLIAGGQLGTLVSASASIRWWRAPDYFAKAGRGMKARDGGGVLLTQAIHTLDLFESLSGPIARVAAMAATSPLRQIDTEDMVGAALGFANGAVGALDATTVAYPGFPERIELAFEAATAILTAETLELFYKDGRTIREEGAESNSGGADPMAFSHESHKALIADFLDALEEKRDPAISGREALKVQILIEALLESAHSGRAVQVELPLESRSAVIARERSDEAIPTKLL
jgi:UDP-N-acetyl-2-amino-2-deoxyglucuronate dehydrogenase